MLLLALTFEAGKLAATFEHCANVCVQGGTFPYSNLAQNPKGLFGALVDIHKKSSGSWKGLIRKVPCLFPLCVLIFFQVTETCWIYSIPLLVTFHVLCITSLTFHILLFLDEWFGSHNIVRNLRCHAIQSTVYYRNPFLNIHGKNYHYIFSWTPHIMKELIILPWTLVVKELFFINTYILSPNNFYDLLVSGTTHNAFTLPFKGQFFKYLEIWCRPWAFQLAVSILPGPQFLQ